MTGYELYVEGASLFRSKQYEKAIPVLCESIAIDPHFKSYQILYKCYSELGRTSIAFECCKRAWQEAPNNDQAATDYASLLILSNQHDEAKQILRSVVNRNPSYKRAKLLLDG
ncbi:tetratricopeptide repeat protein [Calycomorphotria hydatis]|uniref:Tetratricopeptide repeat protein n=1 Tax=Calycomorphotria hydatis TaxID=2528027 RepID=A0A517TCA1_9PLAN|nr:hypothetical protein V22_32660 [Calycomorphotria hydatis]